MKKLFYLAAFASVALVSCAENELAPQTNELQPIGFASPVVTPNSRAQQEIGPNFVTSLPFNVWAYYYDKTTDGGIYTNFAGGQLFMDEVTATYDATNNTWYPKDVLVGGTEQLYYWPKNGSLTFIAYQPTSIKDKVSVGANGLTITDYEVSNTEAANVEEDLLFSERTYNQQKANEVATPYTGTQINFKHALSAILFGVQTGADYPGTTIKLKSIKLNNVVKKGNFNQNLDDANEKLTNYPTVESSKESATAAAWTLSTVPSDKVTYTVTKDQALSTTMYYTATNSTTKPVAYAGGYRNADHILIPQPVSGVELEINYSIQHTGYDELLQVYKVNLSGNWVIGHRYIYNIKISLDPITLSPTVHVWSDTEGGITPGY